MLREALRHKAFEAIAETVRKFLTGQQRLVVSRHGTHAAFHKEETVKRKSLQVFVVSSFVLAFAALVVAQAPETPKPKPGPEHAKLANFVGNWQSDGTIKENPVFPAGKMTSKDRCEWFDGKFAVVCHSEGTSPLGATKGIGIMSYSPEAKSYTYY